VAAGHWPPTLHDRASAACLSRRDRGRIRRGGGRRREREPAQTPNRREATGSRSR
jgi:hypothetical protein